MNTRKLNALRAYKLRLDKHVGHHVTWSGGNGTYDKSTISEELDGTIWIWVKESNKPFMTKLYCDDATMKCETCFPMRETK